MKRIGSALVAIIALSLMTGCPSDPTVGDVQQVDSVPSDSQTADLPPGQICIPGGAVSGGFVVAGTAVTVGAAVCVTMMVPVMQSPCPHVSLRRQ